MCRHLFRMASTIKSFRYEWGLEAEAFYKQHGAASTFRSYPEGHTVSQENYNDFTDLVQKLIKSMNENLGGNKDE